MITTGTRKPLTVCIRRNKKTLVYFYPSDNLEREPLLEVLVAMHSVSQTFDCQGLPLNSDTSVQNVFVHICTCQRYRLVRVKLDIMT